MRAIIHIAAGAALALLAGAAAAKESEPLFAATDMIRLTIRAPFGPIRASAAREPAVLDGALSLDGAARETHPINVSARGITRRKREVCSFPPLRIELAQKPAAGSLFRGQKRLKLVTHCRPQEAFQQFTLLEYAAYRLMNAVTPLSLRARLARIDYAEPGAGKPFLTRLGFLIEDADAAARRNGLEEVDTPSIPVARLSPQDAARYAVFQYLIGNLDWSMNASTEGMECCHNSKLMAARKDPTANLLPVPYDFDYSGLVDAPYAVPPAQVRVASVRTRRYRGYCRHNAEARQAAAEIRAARPALLAVIAEVPELEERIRRKASAFLEESLSHIATDADVEAKLLRTCL